MLATVGETATQALWIEICSPWSGASTLPEDLRRLNLSLLEKSRLILIEGSPVPLQPHHLAAAVHLFQTVETVFRALPAVGDFQPHVFGDVADEARAVGGLGVPDR